MEQPRVSKQHQRIQSVLGGEEKASTAAEMRAKRLAAIERGGNGVTAEDKKRILENEQRQELIGS